MKPALSILFLNRSFYPEISATSQLLKELCDDLSQKYGCDITVISAMPLAGSRNDAQSDGRIRIIRVKSTNFSTKSFAGRLVNYLSYFLLSFFASFRIKKQDVVVALTDPPIISLVGLWAAFRFGASFVISVRDIFPEAAKGLSNARNKPMEFLLGMINRFCFNRADSVVSLGSLMSKRLIEEKGVRPSKVSIITDWADCKKIHPLPRQNPFSAANHLNDFFVVMYSGNMGASSGLEILIESARLLRDRKDILFVFIGEGIMKDRLRKRAEEYRLENTRFFPYQPVEQLSYSFSSSDAFVIPLKKGLCGYSVPSKIYPILASGRTYIACVEEESEISEITRQFQCGLVAKPQDAQDLTEKLLVLYKDRELSLKLSENARHAALHFDRASGVDAYYELFKKLIHDKKNI